MFAVRNDQKLLWDEKNKKSSTELSISMNNRSDLVEGWALGSA